MDGHTNHALRAPKAARRTFLLALLALALSALAGCGSQGGVRDAFGKGLQAIGLKDATAQPQVLPLRLHAADNLNAGSGERAMSLVTRVYQLRAPERFEAAAFDVFLDEQRERDALGDDLLRVTEVLLAPGQRHELLEKLAADSTHIGVVALFREPAPTRWRMTFDAREAGDEGVGIGLHACAMTTASDALVTTLGAPSHSLASSRCAPPAR